MKPSNTPIIYQHSFVNHDIIHVYKEIPKFKSRQAQLVTDSAYDKHSHQRSSIEAQDAALRTSGEATKSGIGFLTMIQIVKHSRT